MSHEITITDTSLSKHSAAKHHHDANASDTIRVADSAGAVTTVSYYDT